MTANDNTKVEITEDMVRRACVALVEFRTNLVGMKGQRQATTETIVRTVLTAALTPSQ